MERSLSTPDWRGARPGPKFLWHLIGVDAFHRPVSVVLLQPSDEGWGLMTRLPGLRRIVADEQSSAFERLTAFKDLEQLELPFLDESASGEIGDEAFTYLTALTKLRRLALSGRIHLSASQLASLSSLSRLESLEYRPHRPVTDEDLEELCQLGQLKHLCLETVDTSATGLECLVQMACLTPLEIKFTDNMSDAALAPIASLDRLRGLRLIASDQFTARGLGQLVRLKQLECLEIDCDAITDDLLASLATLPQLRCLRLRGCHDGHRCRSRPFDTASAILKNCPLLGSREIEPGRNSGYKSRTTRCNTWTQCRSYAFCIWASAARISDEGLQHLKSSDGLRQIHIWNAPRLTTTGVDALRAALPKCMINIATGANPAEQTTGLDD